MNLNTAALLCYRFLSATADGGLFEKLGAVCEAGRTGAGNPDWSRIESAALAARAAYDASFFADPAMRIFPEFGQLGFGGIMGPALRHALCVLAGEDEGDAQPSEKAALGAVARIAAECEGLDELTEQIGKLVSVAEYFGVERRSTFDADAVAVIQMHGDADGKDYSAATMNAFIDRIQSFQSVIGFCEEEGANRGQDSGMLANIRMIAGDDPLIVADMTVAGAGLLQGAIGEARRIQAAVSEIEEAGKRLAMAGISEELLDMLGEESALIRRFEGGRTSSFLNGFKGGEKSGKAKEIAITVLSLLDGGARIDSVVLKPPTMEPPESPESRESPEPMDEAQTREENVQETEVAASAATFPDRQGDGAAAQDQAAAQEEAGEGRAAAGEGAQEAAKAADAALGGPQDEAPQSRREAAPEMMAQNASKQDAKDEKHVSPLRSMWDTFSKR